MRLVGPLCEVTWWITFSLCCRETFSLLTHSHSTSTFWIDRQPLLLNLTYTIFLVPNSPLWSAYKFAIVLHYGSEWTFHHRGWIMYHQFKTYISYTLLLVTGMTDAVPHSWYNSWCACFLSWLWSYSLHFQIPDHPANAHWNQRFRGALWLMVCPSMRYAFHILSHGNQVRQCINSLMTDDGLLWCSAISNHSKEGEMLV
jgi:hypothetical protein